MIRVQIGQFCTKAGGHFVQLGDDDWGACGSHSWDTFVEVDAEDLPFFLLAVPGARVAEETP